MFTQSFLKRVLMFIGIILSGLITLVFVAEPEPFSVPTLDQIPSITTKSTLVMEFNEAKSFFEEPVQNSIPGATLSAIVSWSPNGKYVIANMKFIEKNDIRTQAYVLDFDNHSYVAVPNAKWIDSVSWAENKMTFVSNSKYAVFDVLSRKYESFGKSFGDSFPLISPDGTKIVYAEGGLYYYSIQSGKSFRLTSDQSDVPALWMSDSGELLYVRTIRDLKTKEAISSLIDLDLKPHKERQVAILEKPFKNAKWLSNGETALLTLGFDDGIFDYIYYIKTGQKKFISEASLGSALVDEFSNKIAIVSGKQVSIKDETLANIADATLPGNESVTMARLLIDGKILLVRNVSISSYKISLFNPANGEEQKIGETWLPYVVLSPNQRSLISVAEGNTGVKFFEIAR